MKRASCAVLLLLCTAAFAHASINQGDISQGDINQGDIVQFLAQTSGQSAGYGGSFNWYDTTTNTSFTTFCAEIGGDPNTWIVYGATYRIDYFISPTVGSLINAGDNAHGNPQTLLDLKGIYLLDQWRNGLIAQNSLNAAAVQAQLWVSEGYGDALIASDGGLNRSALQSTIDGLLAGYSDTWGPQELVAVLTAYGNNGYQNNGNPAQDQYVAFGIVDPPAAVSAPEPATVVIWSLLGVGSWLGMRVSRRRRASIGRQPWTPATRQAIHEIIARRSHERT